MLAFARFLEALSRAEESIACIAQAGQDITLCVELAIEGCAIDLHVRMRSPEATYALWCRHETQEANPLSTRAFELAHGGHGAPAGR